MQSQPEMRCVITLSLSLSLQENINIDEAAHCLVKHIIANENDLLQSEVTDTISPQQESSRRGTCSVCFRSWRRSPEELFSIQPHPDSFKSVHHVFSSPSHLLSSLFICVREATLLLCLGFHDIKTYRTLGRAENVLRERDSGEKSICRTSRELQFPHNQKANAVFNLYFIIIVLTCFAVNSYFYCLTEMGWISKTN